MKVRKILTIIVCIAILIPTLNVLEINPVNVPKAKAQGGPPYELVKNPWMNDSDYWSCEAAWHLHEDSFSTITSDGWHSYAKKVSNLIDDWKFNFWKWWQPYGCTFALQGMFPSTVPCEPTTKGQGLNYYVYIPANISDGQIIANITQMRMRDPTHYGSTIRPFGKNPGVAATDRTNIGIYFFLALRVRFWDSPSVPTHLRGKETYLGWTAPRFPDTFYGGCVHAGHIETWTDTRVFDEKAMPPQWKEASVEKGFPNMFPDPIDYPGFMGSTQDWDIHNSRALNNTPLLQWETLTYDVGKRFREMVEWWDENKYDRWLWQSDGLGSNGRFLLAIGKGGHGWPCLHEQAFDIVGAMLLGVGPTIEVINADMEVKVNWVQVYDYRDDGGHPPDDPLFWDCLEHWKWLKAKGFHDPCQDHWVNAILPEETLQFRNVEVGAQLWWDYAQPVTSGNPYGDFVEYLDDFALCRYNLSTSDCIWSKAGVEYKWILLESTWQSLKVNLYWEWQAGPTTPGMSNTGLYLDYEIGGIEEGVEYPFEAGEIIIRDYLPTEMFTWQYEFSAVQFNLTLEGYDVYYVKFTPHIESWWQWCDAQGSMDIYWFKKETEEITYSLKVDVNNPSYGTVDPSGTTEYPAMSEATLTATPAEGYSFGYWRVQNTMHDIDINFTANPLTLCMDMDYNVTAYFEVPPPSNVTVQLSKAWYFRNNWIEYPGVPGVVQHSAEGIHGWINGTGIWTYPNNTLIGYNAIVNEGYDFKGWEGCVDRDDRGPHYRTVSEDSLFRAVFVEPSMKLIFKDAETGDPVTPDTVYFAEAGRNVYPSSSEVTARGRPINYTIYVTAKGYYDTEVVLPKFWATVNFKGYYWEINVPEYTVYLDPEQFSGGGGGNIRPPLMRSKIFTYSFTVLNASSTVYRTWNGMVEVTPISGATATLTLTVHYVTTYPIVEVYAENVAMACFNWTDIYHSLNCPYFDHVPTLTQFYGISINTTRPIILDMGLPAKPKELWKLTPGQEQPGTLLTDWQWNDGRVLLQIVPGDPTVSMLLQSALERARDIPYEFLPLIVTVAMLLVLFKFIKDKL